MAAKRSPGRPTTNSAGSATGRTSSTVTIESMPPPNGTSGRARRSGRATAGERRRAPAPRSAGRTGPGRCGRRTRPAVDVVRAQELDLVRPERRPAARPPAERRSCSTTRPPAGTPSGRPRRRVGPSRPAAGEGEALGEAALAQRVAAGQRAGRRVDVVAVVAEALGHATEAGQGGEAAAGSCGPVAEERRPRRCRRGRSRSARGHARIGGEDPVVGSP